MAETISLSLISHTNVGKTALARTLLGRDVGDVRDAPHVTANASRHTMLESAQGDILYLWDTPGFGDSARLAKRLDVLDSPILRFLAMAWDRWRDRAFWSSQQAVRNVRDDADVVLYLVNASESPADAGYIAPELKILGWIGKPVIVLLNQTGRPRAASEEAAELTRWRDALGRHPVIEGVLPLDAFARCWIQESVLLREVAKALPESKRAAFARLAAAWHATREVQFQASMAAIAAPIARAARERVALRDTASRGFLRDVGKAIGFAGKRTERAKQAAMRTLSERLDADIRASTNRLIAIHHLDGRAADEVTARLLGDIATDSPVDERKAAVIGGFVSGALTGLAADLASGGLTFGAGLLAGGVVGAVGAAGLARGFNVVRGKRESIVRWSDDFIAALVPAAVLRYLAVAHYGRGRGEWAASEYPPFWRSAVATVIERHGGVAPISALRGIADGDIDMLANALQARLAELSLAVLAALYPDAGADALPPSRRSAENATPAG
ncbi:MAG TPA: GTPase domain-containing protein [Casimicrobiaceae bacterium]|nr:GTPase domain-containing protein [Casimicrobiaceae bacterium]